MNTAFTFCGVLYTPMRENLHLCCPLCGAVYDASDLAERAWHEDTDETENGFPVCITTAISKIRAEQDKPR